MYVARMRSSRSTRCLLATTRINVHYFNHLSKDVALAICSDMISKDDLNVHLVGVSAQKFDQLGISPHPVCNGDVLGIDCRLDGKMGTYL